MTFFDLSKDDQSALILHFVDEGFAAGFAEALDECAQLDSEDLELHLDAALNGYMH